MVTKPAIVAVDDDPVVVAAITRDLRSRYSDDYGAMPGCFAHRYLATI